MKLRNKKTGEIKELQEVIHQAYQEHNYNSLAELNEEWEDYEEPRKYWFINTNTHTLEETSYEYDGMKSDEQIGNYFETKEEAEKAVEKLKVLTKLCKKGFEFDGVEMFWNGLIKIEATIPIDEKTTLKERSDITDSLYLLFGGEE